jgi:propionate CoA-transferase
VVFCGTFTAEGLLGGIDQARGKLHIEREGLHRKFVPQVDHITFAGAYSHQRGQEVLYVTERAVFRLGSSGPILTEVAPGMDLEQEVLARMGFRPQVAPDLHEMDRRLFTGERLDLAHGPQAG